MRIFSFIIFTFFSVAASAQTVDFSKEFKFSIRRVKAKLSLRIENKRETLSRYPPTADPGADMQHGSGL